LTVKLAAEAVFSDYVSASVITSAATFSWWAAAGARHALHPSSEPSLDSDGPL